MTIDLTESGQLLRLIDPRLTIHCPTEDLNRKPPYEAWGDLDQLVAMTHMTTLWVEDGEARDHNAVISLGRDLFHHPCLDIDCEAKVVASADVGTDDRDLADGLGLLLTRIKGTTVWAEWPIVGPVMLIPSGSAGHHHAYANAITLTWGEYAEVLEHMRDGDALGRGWVNLSLRRGFTLLRHPLYPKVVDDGEAW